MTQPRAPQDVGAATMGVFIYLDDVDKHYTVAKRRARRSSTRQRCRIRPNLLSGRSRGASLVLHRAAKGGVTEGARAAYSRAPSPVARRAFFKNALWSAADAASGRVFTLPTLPWSGDDLIASPGSTSARAFLGQALNSPCTSVTNRRRVRSSLQRTLGLELTDWRGCHACIALQIDSRSLAILTLVFRSRQPQLSLAAEEEGKGVPMAVVEVPRRLRRSRLPSRRR